MMFLNGIAMLALTAVAVPMAVHLYRRRRSKVVGWAAMRFLSQSSVNRRRGSTLENRLLLLCRCLLIALFVLALARPMLVSAAGVRWVLMLSLGLLGLVASVWAVVASGARWKRLTAGAVAVGSIAIATTLVMSGNETPFQFDQPRDVAIVIDVSSSMNVEIDGQSNFHRAREEAIALVDNLPGGSTVSILTAGPVITALVGPSANLRAVSEELAQLEPMGGGTDLQLAIERARLVLEKAPHAHQQLVIYTDNQLQSWQQVSDQLALTPVSPDPMSTRQPADGSQQNVEWYCRAFPLPPDLRDISVSGLEVDARIVSIHRPVPLKIDLLNGGSTTAFNLELELLVNDQVVEVKPLPELDSRSQTSVSFQCRFEQPGWNSVAARLRGKDQLSDNNVVHRVVHVAEKLPVLIVNGDSTSQPNSRPATFMKLALDPTSFENGDEAENRQRQLIAVDALDAAEIRQVESFADYQVILLCDVPRLPSEIADRLATFVETGGGLWVQAGARCQRDFYNSWKLASSDQSILPMEFVRRSLLDPADNRSLGLDFDSVSHLTLDPLLERGQHDLTELQVSAYWKLAERPNNRSPHIAARLTNGDPLLAEHSVGRGRVLVSSISFDSQESNMINRVSFPVLTHLWVEYLAATNDIDLNLPPNRNLLVRLPESTLPASQSLTVTLPGGVQRPVAALPVEQSGMLSVDVGLAATPGIYRLAAGPQSDRATIPFTVLGDTDEFDLTAASPGKLNELAAGLQVKWIENSSQIKQLAQGALGKIELWKYFATGAMLMMVIEVVLLRWIAWRRRVPATGQSRDSNTAALSESRTLVSSEAGAATGSFAWQSRGATVSVPPLVEARQ